MLNLIIPETCVSSLALAREEVLRYLGGKKHSLPLSESLEKVVGEMEERGRELVQPRFIYRILPVGALSFNSRCLSELCREGEYAAIVVCTIGAAVERAAADFFSQKEYLKGVVLDAAGSALAESLTDNIADTLRKECEKLGYKNSLRVSPGYGDWDVVEQRKIFDLLETPKIGVSLNSSCFMIPLKSVSFISVIGKRLPEVYIVHRKCDFCTKQECKFRMSQNLRRS